MATLKQPEPKNHPIAATMGTSAYVWRVGARVVLRAGREHLTVEVSGELDLGSDRDVLVALLPAIDGGRPVHLDLGGVDFLGSHGLRCLVAANERAAERGTELIIVRLSTAARRTIELTGLDRVLTIADVPI